MSLYLNLLEPRPVRLTALAALASESQFAVGLSLRRSMTSLERMVGDIMIASCLSDIVSLMTRFKVPSRHGMAALRGGVGAVSAELTVKCKVHEVPFRRCQNGGVPASQDSKVPNGPPESEVPSPDPDPGVIEAEIPIPGRNRDFPTDFPKSRQVGNRGKIPIDFFPILAQSGSGKYRLFSWPT